MSRRNTNWILGKKRRVQPLMANLRPGEKFQPFWCQDVALGCVCEEPILFKGLDCISIGRGVTGNGVAYDRCLACGAMWTRREYRWQPAEQISEEVAA